MATIRLEPSSSSSKNHSKRSTPKSTKTKNKIGIEITDTTLSGVNTKEVKHDYKVGNYVCLTDGRQGYIRYVGQTAFSKHILYGIELDDKFEGKHSGMYKGMKYFDTASPNKGVFVSAKKLSSTMIGSGSGSGGSNRNVLSLGGSNRNVLSKHGRKLSAMIYRGGRGLNKSRVSFVVPDMSALLLSPTTSDTDDCMIIDEENEEKYPETATPRIDNVLKKDGRISVISVRIPFGALNSKCMAIILSFLTMKELSQYAFVSRSAHDSIRLVALYDFRYMLYDVLSIQQIRKILCILKFHKPKELVLPLAYFIYDPVVLRLFLQFFNVEKDNAQMYMFKYIHKLVIDDRDIRPSSWLMRPGNYPWNELCNRETAQDQVFPFELVECFQSLGRHLWRLDIRYTMNVELSYFMNSSGSIVHLSVSAENRMDVEQFYNVTHLCIQNKNKTWEEIERTELIDWKSSFRHLSDFRIINQRFECSFMDLFCAITWLPSIKTLFVSNCHFNESTLFEGIQHTKRKCNLNNRLHALTIKKQSLSKALFAVVSQFFLRMNKLFIIDCKLRKSLDFEFFKHMTHLTNITITNLKRIRNKKIKMSYSDFLHSIYASITKYVYVCPVIIECNLIKSAMEISSHIRCAYCKQLIDKKRMNDHLTLLCPETTVRCPLCDGKVKRKSLTYHWSNNCKEYYIQCFLCPKVFTVKTKHMLHDHVLRHSLDLDQESAKYDMLFIHNEQSVQLTNEYPVYTITNCTQCQCRAIGPVVITKYREKLIPNQCDSCEIWNGSDNQPNDAKTKSKRISLMKQNRGKKVLIHPYPKNIKLKSIK